MQPCHRSSPRFLWSRLALAAVLGGGCGGGTGGSPDAPATDAAGSDAPGSDASPDAYVPQPHTLLFYSSSDDDRIDLWQLPVGSDVPSKVFSRANTEASRATMVGNKAYFVVEEYSLKRSKVYVYDPTQPLAEGQNPVMAFSINAPAMDDGVSELFAHDGVLYFPAFVDEVGPRTFRFDPTLPVSGSNPAVLFPGYAWDLAFVADHIIAGVNHGAIGDEISIFDLGQPASGLNPAVVDLTPGAPGSFYGEPAVDGTNVYFRARQELYVYDASLPISGTNPQLVIPGGTDGSGAGENVRGPDGRIYSAGSTDYDTFGTELMIYDPATAVGAGNPTQFDFISGVQGLGPAYMVGLGNRLFMRANSPTLGTELAIFDPAMAASATNPTFVDLVEGAASSDPRDLVSDGTNLYLTLNIQGTGTFLVHYDSTQPLNVPMNPRPVLMAEFDLYGLTIGTYLQ